MYLLQNIRQILRGRIQAKKNILAQWQVLLKVLHSQRNCVMLWISVNIPLRKLNNPTRKNFIKKYSGKRIPDESTLKKNT